MDLNKNSQFSETNITLGKLFTSALPGFFPNVTTQSTLYSLATFHDSGLLRKRFIGVQYPTLYGTFTCSIDATSKRPYQDCINLVAIFCQNTSPLFSNWGNCQSKLVAVRDMLNSNFKNYINFCARFLGGNANSANCQTATNVILRAEYYVWYDSDNVLQLSYIPKSVLDGIKSIWYLT